MVIVDLCRTEAYKQLLSLPDDGFNYLRKNRVVQKGHADRSVVWEKIKNRFVANLMQRQLDLYGDLP